MCSFGIAKLIAIIIATHLPRFATSAFLFCLDANAPNDLRIAVEFHHNDSAKFRRIVAYKSKPMFCSWSRTSGWFKIAADMVGLMMGEGSAVARSVGIELKADPQVELERVRGNLAQQPSMLQDVRAG